ncbi:MAG: acyl carrier protein [Oscillospiraceae bacterium]|jgi:acyl carrier protein|nr:acyl carrier protein [Oscillospiraceae bacterium]
MLDRLTEQIKEIIAEQLNLDSADITLDTRFKEDLDADSIDLAELAMTIEDKFRISTPENGNLPELITVRDVINYVKDYSAD